MVAIRTTGWDTNVGIKIISHLDVDEMKDLIRQIPTDIAGMGNPATPNMPDVFKTLSRVLSDPYTGDDFGHHAFIQLACGIHQDNELHYTINCSGVNGAIHVYVGQGPRQVVTKMIKESGPYKKRGIAGKPVERTLFPYKNTGLSHKEHPQAATQNLWPAVFRKETWKNRVRGTSFCTGNVSPGLSLDEINKAYPPPKS